MNTKKPDHNEIVTAWQTAMGIQAADGLRTSDYLWQISQKNINGTISINEAKEELKSYYLERNANDLEDPEKEDADITAVNITKILLSDSLDFSAQGLATLNRKIFDGVRDNAGEYREFELSKREWVLGGDIVNYMSPEALPGSLENCIAKEKNYAYNTSSPDNLISHLAAFIASIWQICPFGEGNSRFAAVFTILYLRYLGIRFKIDTFKNDSYYFHNALVRANYRNLEKNIEYEPVYLERFFRNILLSDQWDLRNRYVHVRPAAEWRTQTRLNNSTSTGQVQVEKEERKIEEKVEKEVRKEKVKIETKNVYPEISPDFLPEIVEITGGPDNYDNYEKDTPNKPGENLSDNTNLIFLATAIGEEFLSVKDIMGRLNLKGRDNFVKLYLSPAIIGGFVTPLYPKSPRHPRQKYLLTQKGLDYLKNLSQETRARVEHHLAKGQA